MWFFYFAFPLASYFNIQLQSNPVLVTTNVRKKVNVFTLIILRSEGFSIHFGLLVSFQIARFIGNIFAFICLIVLV